MKPTRLFELTPYQSQEKTNIILALKEAKLKYEATMSRILEDYKRMEKEYDAVRDNFQQRIDDLESLCNAIDDDIQDRVEDPKTTHQQAGKLEEIRDKFGEVTDMITFGIEIPPSLSDLVSEYDYTTTPVLYTDNEVNRLVKAVTDAFKAVDGKANKE